MAFLEMIFLIVFVVVSFGVSRLMPQPKNKMVISFVQVLIFAFLFRKIISRTLNEENFFLLGVLIIFFGYLLFKIVQASRIKTDATK